MTTAALPTASLALAAPVRAPLGPRLKRIFACQALARLRVLPFDRQHVHPGGGALALGHPIGRTAGRQMVTLVRGLARAGGRLGVATHHISGGMGLAALVEGAA